MTPHDDAPVPVEPVAEAYDAIARVYDRLYRDPRHREQDRQVGRLARHMLEDADSRRVDGRVLDIGCGTGLLLEQLPVDPLRYLGVDVSRGMIDVAREKFPRHRFGLQDCQALIEATDSCATVFGLFGVLSLASKERTYREVRRVLAPGGTFVLMGYAAGHQVRDLAELGVTLPRLTFFGDDAEVMPRGGLFADVQVQRLLDGDDPGHVIVTGRRR